MGHCNTLKREFDREKVTFKNLDHTIFVRCEWPVPHLLFVVLRFLLFLYCLFGFVYFAVTVNSGLFRFFTIWSYLALTVHLGFAAFLTLLQYRPDFQRNFQSQKPKTRTKILSISYENNTEDICKYRRNTNNSNNNNTNNNKNNNNNNNNDISNDLSVNKDQPGANSHLSDSNNVTPINTIPSDRNVDMDAEERGAYTNDACELSEVISTRTGKCKGCGVDLSIESFPNASAAKGSSSSHDANTTTYLNTLGKSNTNMNSKNENPKDTSGIKDEKDLRQAQSVPINYTLTFQYLSVTAGSRSKEHICHSCSYLTASSHYPAIKSPDTHIQGHRTPSMYGHSSKLIIDSKFFMNTPFYFQMSWIIANIACLCAPIVTVIYFTTIHPNAEESLDFNDVNVHILNLVFVFIDQLISARPVRLAHCYVGMLFGIAYVIFNIIFWSLDHENNVIYKILDWNNPGPAVAWCVSLLIAIPFLQLFYYGLRRLKLFINCCC